MYTISTLFNYTTTKKVERRNSGRLGSQPHHPQYTSAYTRPRYTSTPLYTRFRMASTPHLWTVISWLIVCLFHCFISNPCQTKRQEPEVWGPWGWWRAGGQNRQWSWQVGFPIFSEGILSEFEHILFASVSISEEIPKNLNPCFSLNLSESSSVTTVREQPPQATTASLQVKPFDIIFYITE